MTRLEANLLIIERLTNFLTKHPDQRFGQALINLDIIGSSDIPKDANVAIYNEEPIDILTRLQKNTL